MSKVHPMKMFDLPAGEERVTPENMKRCRILNNKNGQARFVNTTAKDSYWDNLNRSVIDKAVTAPWRMIIACYVIAVASNWLLFASIYYAAAWSHGDLAADARWEPCIKGTHTFTSFVLYSMESQTTIGYGYPHDTDQCAAVIFVVKLQNMYSGVISLVLLGVFMGKIFRTTKRHHTLLFSEHAVINRDDRGNLQVQFRVADMQRTSVYGASCRLHAVYRPLGNKHEMFTHRKTHESTTGFESAECELATCTMILNWPHTCTHTINMASPLFNLSQRDYSLGHVELVATLVANDPLKGSTCICRHSYMANDIKWGYRFQDIAVKEVEGLYEVDYQMVNQIQAITPNALTRF